MNRLAISYTILVIVSVIFNCTFQLCMARPEEEKKSSDNQTVDIFILFYFISLFVQFMNLFSSKTNAINFIKIIHQKKQETGTATRSDANDTIPNGNLNKNSEQELAFKKCGLPNKMGLNKEGLEFLSSGQTKAGNNECRKRNSFDNFCFKKLNEKNK